jgi:hypothetical protein
MNRLRVLIGSFLRVTPWLAVAALVVAALTSLAMRQTVRTKEPRLVSAGERPRGNEPLMTWSEAPRVEYRYEFEIVEGDDLLISVTSAALSDCQLVLEPLIENAKVSPSPLMMHLTNLDNEHGTMVVSGASRGARHILVRGRCIWDQQREDGQQTIDVDTTDIPFVVLPSRIFGLTEAQLKGLQVLSQVVGLPALLGAIVKTYLDRRRQRGLDRS